MPADITPSLRHGSLFITGLAASAMLFTVVFAVAIRTMDDPSWRRMIPWITLWVFTVLTPTATSFRLHRHVTDIARSAPAVPDDLLRDVAQMRWTCLIQGGMAALAAISVYVNH